VEYLKSDSEWSREFTENRLRCGVALSSNVKYVFPDWRNRRMRRDLRIIDEIGEHAVGGVRRVHDVGCGVGFFLEAARARGLEATGNELNGYAYKVMKERLGLDVYQEVLPELPLEENSLDAVTMNDYIEHTYDPLGDLKAAYRLLRPGGVLWLNTFHVDCLEFEKLKGNWNMLFWNHVYHFSTASLRDIVGRAGFDVRLVATSRDSVNVKVVARKSA
jgi:SAM-dependent methyltransferase